MTGLNLESFLHLLRADLGAWAVLGLIVFALGLMVWTSWGSRRALRKCLVLSVTAHAGLALYGSTLLVMLRTFPARSAEESKRERIRQIRVAPWVETKGGPGSRPSAARGFGRGATATWDQARDNLALADPKRSPDRPEPPPLRPEPPAAPALPPEAASPEVSPPEPAKPESLTPTTEAPAPAPIPGQAAPADPAEIAPVVVARPGEPEPEATPLSGQRLRPGAGRPQGETSAARPTDEAIAGLTAPRWPEPAAPPAPHPEPSTAEPSLLALPAPSAAVEPSSRELPAPEMVRGGTPEPASGSSLADLNLRRRAGRPEPGDVPPRPRGGIPASSSRPSIALAPAPIGIMEPGARPADRPRATADLGSGPVPAVVDPATTEGVPEAVKRPRVPDPAPVELPEIDMRRQSRPSVAPPLTPSRGPVAMAVPIALSHVAPSGMAQLPQTPGTTAPRLWTDVPEVYRSRLDPNRTARAQKAGASAASEQAVERALDWLARHQDSDGRWDGATARNDDGTVFQNDDDYTIHCPPGETCFGTSLYWEADTALTGLALLAYLGSGYTHAEGKYAETVRKGLSFLVGQQKADGDLRGKSRNVGMYGHAMATLALCEAYALTGDRRLRPPVERALSFLIRSRAQDNLAWRYAPGAPVGDTSILGWVVMALKSGREVGLPIPNPVQQGILTWLGKVESGPAKGLARYQPWDAVTPTMTAEAWVCRQFLGVGGPGAASTEAADHLLQHGPRRDPYNLYYWYYGTLAMYQHGGEAWTRWNNQVRDQIVQRQHSSGHIAGSWDPDESKYGAIGGRIYCTALATLTLEVYYRFLRLYEEPQLPTAAASSSPPAARSAPRRPVDLPAPGRP
jgi:hypothetical protein